MGNCGCCRSRASAAVRPFPEEDDKPRNAAGSTTVAPESSHSQRVLVDVVPGWEHSGEAADTPTGQLVDSEASQPSKKSEANGNENQVLSYESDTGNAVVVGQSTTGKDRTTEARLSNHSRGGSVKNVRSQKTAGGHTDDLHSRPQVAIGKPFPKRPMVSKLSVEAWHKIETLFRQMDVDGSNAVTKLEADQFFKGSFAKLSADAMFNEVDQDGSGAITAEEFVGFWVQVRSAGYKELEITETLDELIEGGSWVDWDDKRNTDHSKEKCFPKRPFLCKMSATGWSKCEELFKAIDKDGSLAITREKAMKHYSGTFKTLATDAMFNEIDVNHHGIITPKEFMSFWVQVRWSGYKEKDIIEEIDSLLEGNGWVDWKDGRQT